MKLTKQQKENLVNKRTPQKDKEYILTDDCFWDSNPPQDYNIFDPKRKPHAVSLVEKDTGTVVMLKSGSIIKVIIAK